MTNATVSHAQADPDSPRSPQVSADSGPLATYQARLAASRGEANGLERRHRLLGWLRLAWVGLLGYMFWLAAVEHRLPWLLLLVPVAGFGLTARAHSRILARLSQQRRVVAWYEHGLARLEGRWPGLKPRPTPPAAADSLFAADLDLFGPAGLFELLCTAETAPGEATLAAWLLQTADPEEVLARQGAVDDTRGRLPLREAMAGAGGVARHELQTEALAGWGRQSVPTLPPAVRWVAPCLAAATVGAALFWATGHSRAPFATLLLLNGSFTFGLERRFKPLLAETERAAKPLRRIALHLACLEKEKFRSPWMQARQTPLLAEPTRASVALQQLARLAGAAEQRANLIARLLDFVLLYSVQVASAADRWRRRHGRQIEAWFQALGESEALLALASYSFEHPEDPFPLLTPETEFAAEGLGHPLLKEEQCVRNDLHLNETTRLLVVSGSNMSGKSTLLRAAGVACVMASAGAPVRVRRLRVGPLRVAASIRVQDSLQAGQSRFFAEILRLRAVCALARMQPPVLFLLDELLAGTNSHDRLAGATGVVEALLRTGALGLVSTHDLALTALGSPLAALSENAHFEDQIGEGALHFDHRLRPGVLTRSNGLELMRLIGLEV